MTKSYGLPLIFKLTHPLTGEDLDPSKHTDVTFPRSGFRIRSCAIDCQCQCACNCELFPVERQQTGFTDAAGNDVYFGDVLVNADHHKRPYVAQLFRGAICLVYISKNKSENIVWPSCPQDKFAYHYIVGNVCEPPEKWLERAREIWPDAQLTEEIKGE